MAERNVDVELTVGRASEYLHGHLTKSLPTLFAASHAVFPQPSRAMPTSSLTTLLVGCYLFSHDGSDFLLGHLLLLCYFYYRFDVGTSRVPIEMTSYKAHEVRPEDEGQRLPAEVHG